MRRIVLVRHATAVDADPKGSDFHRRLRKRGLREAAVMAERVVGVVGKPDLMVTSPAARALETAKIFALCLEYPEKRLLVSEELYGGLLPAGFLGIVRRLSSSHRTVVFFGHDPSFTEFASSLDPEFGQAIPKAGVVILDVGRRPWTRVRPGGGRVVLFESPPKSKEEGRPLEKVRGRLAADIEEGILRAAARSGVPGIPAVVRTVSGASRRLAEALHPYAASSGRDAQESKVRARPSPSGRKPTPGKRGRR